MGAAKLKSRVQSQLMASSLMQLILIWGLISYEEDGTQGVYELIVDEGFIG